MFNPENIISGIILLILELFIVYVIFPKKWPKLLKIAIVIISSIIAIVLYCVVFPTIFDRLNIGSYGSETSHDLIDFSKECVVTHTGTLTKCTGEITNYGTSTYKKVQIRVDFLDSSKNVISSQNVSAVGPEGLMPGRSRKFETFVNQNPNIMSCSAQVIDCELSDE